MKAYFLDLLNNLDKLAGLRQVEKIMNSSPNPKAEINELIAVLVRVSEQFPYIPEQDQKNIISAAVITDAEFNSLNARIVYKWLNIHKDKFFKEVAHMEQEKEKDWVPLTGDARMAKLKEFEKILQGFDDHHLSDDKIVPYADVREIKKPVSVGYIPPTAEEVRMGELKIQYARECTDLKLGYIKPGSPTFESWLQINGL